MGAISQNNGLTSKLIFVGMNYTLNQFKTGHNSTYPKGGVSFSKDSFVVNQILVFQIKLCGKSPALRVAANRCTLLHDTSKKYTAPKIHIR